MNALCFGRKLRRLVPSEFESKLSGAAMFTKQAGGWVDEAKKRGVLFDLSCVEWVDLGALVPLILLVESAIRSSVAVTVALPLGRRRRGEEAHVHANPQASGSVDWRVERRRKARQYLEYLRFEEALVAEHLGIAQKKCAIWKDYDASAAGSDDDSKDEEGQSAAETQQEPDDSDHEYEYKLTFPLTWLSASNRQEVKALAGFLANVIAEKSRGLEAVDADTLTNVIFHELLDNVAVYAGTASRALVAAWARPANCPPRRSDYTESEGPYLAWLAQKQVATVEIMFGDSGVGVVETLRLAYRDALRRGEAHQSAGESEEASILIWSFDRWSSSTHRRANRDPSIFSLDDLVNLALLASKLKQPADAVSSFLKDQLSPATLTALANYQISGADEVPLQEALVEDLNMIIHGPSIYDARRFAGVTLRPKTKQLLAREPKGDALSRLNRLLLEDAYPLELSRNRGTRGLYRVDRIVKKYQGLVMMRSDTHSIGWDHGGAAFDQPVVEKRRLSAIPGTILGLWLPAYHERIAPREPITEPAGTPQVSVLPLGALGEDGIESGPLEQLRKFVGRSQTEGPACVVGFFEEGPATRENIENAIRQCAEIRHPGMLILFGIPGGWDLVETAVDSVNQEHDRQHRGSETRGRKDYEVWDPVLVLGYNEGQFAWAGTDSACRKVLEALIISGDSLGEEGIRNLLPTASERGTVLRALRNDPSLVRISEDGGLHRRFGDVYSVIADYVTKTLRTYVAEPNTGVKVAEGLFMTPTLHLVKKWLDVPVVLDRTVGQELAIWALSTKVSRQLARKSPLDFVISESTSQPSHVKLFQHYLGILHRETIPCDTDAAIPPRVRLVESGQFGVIFLDIISSGDAALRCIHQALKDDAEPLAVACLFDARDQKDEELNLHGTRVPVIALAQIDVGGRETKTIVNYNPITREPEAELDENKKELRVTQDKLVELVKRTNALHFSHVGRPVGRHFTFYLDANPLLETRDIYEAFNAEIDGWKTGISSSMFSVVDLVHLPSLAGKLKQPTDGVSTWLKTQLSPATLTTLANYQGLDPDPGQLQTVLAPELNRIIGGPSIYDVQRFTGVALLPETQQLLKGNPQGDALVRLNRLLLEDACLLPKMLFDLCYPHPEPKPSEPALRIAQRLKKRGDVADTHPVRRQPAYGYWSFPAEHRLNLKTENVVVVDWGAITGQSVMQMMRLAGQAGARRVLVCIFLSQLPYDEELFLTGVRMLKMDQWQRVPPATELLPGLDKGTRLADVEVQVAVRFLSRFPVVAYRPNECPVCQSLERFSEDACTNPLLAGFASDQIHERLRLRTREEVLDKEPKDYGNRPLSSEMAVWMASTREELHDALSSTTGRLSVASKVVAWAEQQAKDKTSEITAFMHLLAVETQWLGRPPLSFQHIREAVGKIALAAVLDTTKDIEDRRNASSVLRAASKDLFARHFSDIFAASCPADGVLAKVCYDAFTYVSRPSRESSEFYKALETQLRNVLSSITDGDIICSPKVVQTLEWLQIKANVGYANAGFRSLTPVKAWAKLRQIFLKDYLPHEMVPSAILMLQPSEHAEEIESAIEHDVATGKRSKVVDKVMLRYLRNLQENWRICCQFLDYTVLPLVYRVRSVLLGKDCKDALGSEVAEGIVDLASRLIEDGASLADSEYTNLIRDISNEPSRILDRRTWKLFREETAWWAESLLNPGQKDLRSSRMIELLSSAPAGVASIITRVLAEKNESGALQGVVVRGAEGLDGSIKVFCTENLLANCIRQILENVVKHRVCASSEVWVSVFSDDDEARLLWQNNGTKPGRFPGGDGLRLLREHLKPFDATLTVESRPAAAGITFSVEIRFKRA
jgi:orotate phosphoribosyltransferase